MRDDVSRQVPADSWGEEVEKEKEKGGGKEGDMHIRGLMDGDLHLLIPHHSVRVSDVSVLRQSITSTLSTSLLSTLKYCMCFTFASIKCAPLS